MSVGWIRQRREPEQPDLGDLAAHEQRCPRQLGHPAEFAPRQPLPADMAAAVRKAARAVELEDIPLGLQEQAGDSHRRHA